jgi:16S rRNA (cytidine1402-2'-O)-methyltransferase
MNTPRSTGRLVLVPNALDLGTDPVPLQDVLSDASLRRAASLSAWVVENAKTARAFLKRVGEIHPLTQPLQALSMTELPRPRKGDPGPPSSPRPGANCWRRHWPGRMWACSRMPDCRRWPTRAPPGAGRP